MKIIPSALSHHSLLESGPRLILIGFRGGFKHIQILNNFPSRSDLSNRFQIRLAGSFIYSTRIQIVQCQVYTLK